MKSSRLKNIAFVWDWEPDFEQSITWRDGLCAALKELENRGYSVERYADTLTPIPHPYGTIHRLKDFDPNVDVILHWGDMTRPHARKHKEYNKPMAICFAGGEPLGENFPFFDHVFVESEVYKKVFDEAGLSCSIAFGTNTDLFRPVEAQKKTIDTIFPATFAAWKRHELYAQATLGLKSVACGYMYETHEQECWQICMAYGSTVLPHVSAEVLHHLYAASKVCVITSSSAGGSQRSVLEALAMNLPVIVTDSDKFDYDHLIRVSPTPGDIRNAIDEVLQGSDELPETRSYVLDNWSHIRYADMLEEGLKKIV